MQLCRHIFNLYALDNIHLNTKEKNPKYDVERGHGLYTQKQKKPKYFLGCRQDLYTLEKVRSFSGKKIT